MTTNISIMDDGYNFVSEQPVMGVYALYQTPPPAPATALGTVDPEPVVEDEDAKAAEAEVEAKVVTSPGKSPAAKTAAASEAVVTK